MSRGWMSWMLSGRNSNLNALKVFLILGSDVERVADRGKMGNFCCAGRRKIEVAGSAWEHSLF